MIKLGLVDGDIIAYRCAATCEGDNYTVAAYRMEDMLYRVFESAKCHTYKIYLSGKDSYRKTLDASYKANRRTQIQPVHLNFCKEYLADKWKAKVTDSIEADDALGIEQCSHSDNEDISTVICSIDKDLLQIPGNHYNFIKEQLTVVDSIEAFRHFYRQLLIGDSSDNVKGVRGIGKVKAGYLINSLQTEQEMYNCVKEQYKDDKRLHLNCDLLWIQRKENEKWTDRRFYHETTVG